MAGDTRTIFVECPACGEVLPAEFPLGASSVKTTCPDCNAEFTADAGEAQTTVSAKPFAGPPAPTRVDENPTNPSARPVPPRSPPSAGLPGARTGPAPSRTLLGQARVPGSASGPTRPAPFAATAKLGAPSAGTGATTAVRPPPAAPAASPRTTQAMGSPAARPPPAAPAPPPRATLSGPRAQAPFPAEPTRPAAPGYASALRQDEPTVQRKAPPSPFDDFDEEEERTGRSHVPPAKAAAAGDLDAPTAIRPMPTGVGPLPSTPTSAPTARTAAAPAARAATIPMPTQSPAPPVRSATAPMPAAVPPARSPTAPMPAAPAAPAPKPAPRPASTPPSAVEREAEPELDLDSAAPFASGKPWHQRLPWWGWTAGAFVVGFLLFILIARVASGPSAAPRQEPPGPEVAAAATALSPAPSPPVAPAPIAPAPAPTVVVASPEVPREAPRAVEAPLGSTHGGKRGRRLPVVVDYDSPRTREGLEAAATPPAGTAEIGPSLERARAAYRLGNRDLYAGNAPGALSKYRDALREYPAYAAGYRGMGLAFTLQNDTTHARDAFDHYLQMAPGARDAALIRRRLDAMQGP